MREKSVRELQGWEPACSSSSPPLPSSSPYSSSCSPMGPCGFMACLTTPAPMSPAPPLSPFPNDCRRPWTTRGHASLRSRLLGSFCGMCVCVCVRCRLALPLLSRREEDPFWLARVFKAVARERRNSAADLERARRCRVVLLLVCTREEDPFWLTAAEGRPPGHRGGGERRAGAARAPAARRSRGGRCGGQRGAAVGPPGHQGSCRGRWRPPAAQQA